jgi:hypothetical protein
MFISQEWSISQLGLFENTWFCTNTCKAMLLLDVSIVLKNSMVTWQGSQLSFKKCTIWAKVSTPLLDILRWYNANITWIRDGDTNLSLVISTILSKISCLNFCFNGKFSQGLCLQSNFLKISIPTNDRGTSSLVVSTTRSSLSYFLWWLSLL